MRTATILCAMCLFAGCSLFKPAANVAFTVEPGTQSESPDELAAVLRGRLENMGAPSGEVVVTGRTVEVRTHLAEPADAVRRLLRPFHVEFALADDRKLASVAGALHKAQPSLVTSPTYGESDGQTVCSKDRVVLEKAMAGMPVSDRVWAVQSRVAYGGEAAAAPDLCAILLEPTVLDNQDITWAEAFESDYGDMAVRVAFNKRAGQTFATMTGSAVKRRLAIVLDGTVVSVPVIQERITGGKAHITMGRGPGSDQEAVALAAALSARPLPSQPTLLTIKMIAAK